MSFCFRGDRRWLQTHPLLGAGDGKTAGFAVIPGPCERDLTVIFSDGLGWEHVSISTPKRTPTWSEMCFVKDQFWHAEDVVVQFHPARSEYVNRHQFCLHLWRPSGQNLQTPDRLLVG